MCSFIGTSMEWPTYLLIMIQLSKGSSKWECWTGGSKDVTKVASEMLKEHKKSDYKSKAPWVRGKRRAHSKIEVWAQNYWSKWWQDQGERQGQWEGGERDRDRIKAQDHDRGRDSVRERERDEIERDRDRGKDRGHPRSKDRGRESG